MAAHVVSQANDGHLEGPNILEQRVLGRDIYVYGGRGGCVLFFLWDVETPIWLTALSAHTLFGDSSFRSRSPNLR